MYHLGVFIFPFCQLFYVYVNQIYHMGFFIFPFCYLFYVYVNQILVLLKVDCPTYRLILTRSRLFGLQLSLPVSDISFIVSRDSRMTGLKMYIVMYE